MTVVDSQEGYRLWSAAYDADLNPILALESRVLRERFSVAPGTRVLDLATGTGRWLEYVLSRGARAWGVDLSAEMLARADAKGMSGRLVRATLPALPFRDNFADLAICSLALGYLAEPHTAFREMARVARCVIVSDLHPEAVRAGWSRSFRREGRHYQLLTYHHSREFLDHCAQAAGLSRSWQFEARFDQAERAIFEKAGKRDAFDDARQYPAVLATCWTRS